MKTSARGWVCAVSAVILSSSAAFLSGCAGLVSGADTAPASVTLDITNVQARSVTDSSCQVLWTTNVAADSSVDFGTTTAYGSSTPVNSGMVTTHEVTLTGLSSNTTYYYQVNSVDSKGNHGHGGNTFKTSGNSTPGAPTVTTQPGNQTVAAGQTATFAVTATGTAPLSYQWQKNGASIAGATAASYTTPATTTADSGSTFAVVVTNTAGTVTSAAATLTVNPAPAPTIQVSSTSLNLGNAVVGTNSSQVLIITNTGTATLTITQVTTSGSAVFSVGGFSVPLSVNPGAQTTITVTFQPTAVGTVSGNVSIVSNAPTSPTSVALTGTGIAATFTLGISPTSLSFGNVTTSTSSVAQNVTITNTGNSSVSISQITLSVSGYSMTGGSAPVTLSPSQILTLAILFSPTTAGTVNGSISIASNATGSPATISLSGTGVTPIQHSVALTWNASTSTVSGYNVYRSTVSGSSYTKINSSLVAVLNYTDSIVVSGTTYFYVTTAVDSTGNESVFSNEASAPIP